MTEYNITADVKYNINLPWETLDDWQKEYINTDPNQNSFLLCGRQVGKTTAMSIKAVELCIRHFKKGENILICSITEKQAYRMLAKALAYAETKYKWEINFEKENRPTMHRIIFKNGTGIYCYAAGETGEGLRGDTIKKLMVDEGSRMSEEFFISVQPMLSVVHGSMDIASTPFGKLHRDGEKKFFYKCSTDERFKKFYVNAEDCPRHDKEFLKRQKETLPKLAYAQEYLAVFTDELRRLFSEELIKSCCIAEKIKVKNYNGAFYIGCDIAGFGEDECTYEIFERMKDNRIIQRENLVEKRNYTTDTSNRIISLDKFYQFRKIGVDDGGVGFGVYSELMNNDSTKRKTIALNNASRLIDKEGEKSKKILKEEMYFLLLTLMEQGRIRLLDDREVKSSLASMQYEDEEIYGCDSHVSEGIIRAVWLAEKEKGLNIFAHTF